MKSRRFESLVVLLTLSATVCHIQGQLNYEGNPLTENTEYTAEETRSSFSDRTARQKLYPVYTNETETGDTTEKPSTKITQVIEDEEVEEKPQETGRSMSMSTYQMQQNQMRMAAMMQQQRQIAYQQQQQKHAQLQRHKLEQQKMKQQLIEQQKVQQMQQYKLQQQQMEQQKLQQTQQKAHQLQQQNLNQQNLQRVQQQNLEQQNLQRVQPQNLEQQNLQRVQQQNLEQQNLQRVQPQNLEQQNLQRVQQQNLEQQKLQRLQQQNLEQQNLQRLQQQNLEQQNLQRLQQQNLEQQNLQRLQQQNLEQQNLQQLQQQNLQQLQQQQVQSQSPLQEPQVPEVDNKVQQMVQQQSQPPRQLTPAEVALNTFLTSKTPEESQYALNYYLNSQATSRQQPHISEIVLPQRLQQQYPDPYSGNHLSSYAQDSLASGSQDHIYPTQNLQDPNYGMYQPYHTHRYYTNMDAHKGEVVRLPYRRPIYRYPTNMPMTAGIQSRIGPPISYVKPGIHPTFKFQPPMEVVYSRPPVFARSPSISKPPIVYDDPSWSDSPTLHPTKDILYSQLYAQSYDPHYYNYIAKTGKVKPWLYGKLRGDEEEEEEKDDGIMWELYRGFKNNGLKKIMNPSFLLGLTIPALTIMLMGLVQQRSLLARSMGSSANMTSTDEDKERRKREIEEYLKRLQKALDCYGKLGPKGKKEDCWR